MAGAKGRPRRMEVEHATYNVLLPVTTISEIKKKAKGSGASSAQVVRDVLAEGLGESKKKKVPNSKSKWDWRAVVRFAMKVVRDAYPAPRYADGSYLGDKIASKIEVACEKKMSGK